MNPFELLVDTSDFPARWHCGRWTTAHGWVHIVADLAVAIAYFAIPCVLVYFVRKRRDVPFLPVFWLFSAFILSCGFVHLIEASIFWFPWYRLSASGKVLTAVVSWATVVGLVRVLPTALRLPAVERVNQELTREIAERKKAEEALRLSEQRFALAAAGSSQGIWDWNMTTGDTYYSDRWFELLGLAPGDLPAQVSSWFERIHPEDRPLVEDAVQAHLERRETVDVEHRVRMSDGQYRWFRGSGQAVRDQQGQAIRMAGSFSDVHARKQAETERTRALEQTRDLNAQLEDRVRIRTAELQGLLEEREVLLQEVHHRVKNNLQVISSLINMQGRRLQSKDAVLALEECQNRIQAIALIHERLYSTQNYAEVSFSEYATQLATSILHANQGPTQIDLEVDLPPLGLAVDQAIPAGLVLSELITNAVKHAFVSRDRGKITVRLRTEAGFAQLIVADDGVGAGDELPVSQRSLGLRIIETLAKQLRGTLHVSSDQGSRFTLHFPIKPGPSPSRNAASAFAGRRPGGRGSPD